MIPVKLVQVITDLLKNNTAFVAFRKPDSDEPQLFAGGNFDCINELSEISEKGFVLHPFHDGDEKIRFLKPEFIAKSWEFQLDLSMLKTHQKGTAPQSDMPFLASKTAYFDQANTLISKLKKGELNKIVLSRVIAHDLNEIVDWGRVFEQLCHIYPTAFVYVLSDGKGLFWAGATPETLVSVNKNTAYTMALAGTQAAKLHSDETYFWQQKDLDEQQYVSDYVIETLNNLKVKNLKVSETKTQPAGKLAHLVNHINFEMPEAVSALQLAQRLHPTPAICGLPAKNALELILKTEMHRRSYYSGFLGVIQDNYSADFYVNLRCVQVIGGKLFSYVGGGLTADSNPEKEWEETVLKSKTMLSLFTK